MSLKLNIVENDIVLQINFAYFYNVHVNIKFQFCELNIIFGMVKLKRLLFVLKFCILKLTFCQEKLTCKFDKNFGHLNLF